ncbi:MurR/RpiR family transcriptional regulator [Paenibacillus sp. 7124]|uniref:MurR/RpiR family transcriptional regulator n=1 Tax=Paenibacillus apii TaxID=1850370 RepID=A0A6M1PM12_9BACL|nr:MurR/RpiR family transcriptional regulator [Paenibacillus apii]NGM82893.1 MurR/RpiR family transcriptional regulator [Paenibacillus apii]NJJ40033.1 MurR/RpiR family transcriptional regulator [Paenibacillus apii]
MNGGLIRLREMLETLNPSESKIASYILQHPDEIIHLSVAELAQKSGSSQAAIVRLCKSIGFKGYQELKIKVAGDLHTRDPVAAGYQEIRPNDTVPAIMQNVSNNNIQSIRDTLTILDPNMVELAVKALDRARRIYFFGVGASNLIAMDAQQKFLRINKTSFSFADPHVQLTSAITADSGDTAVCISYSGETKEVIRAASLFKEQGGTVISITKYGHSTLSRQADIPLCTSSTENEIRSGAMASRITQLNLIDILYLAVASRNYEQSVTYLEKSRQTIKQL